MFTAGMLLSASCWQKSPAGKNATAKIWLVIADKMATDGLFALHLFSIKKDIILTKTLKGKLDYQQYQQCHSR